MTSHFKPEVLTRDEWLALHHDPGIVSASEVLAAAGESHYKSPYTLWAQKTGRAPWESETIPMLVGHALEPVCEKLYTEETGRALTDLGDYTILRHPEHPWLICTPDRIAHKSPVEFKTTKDFRAWAQDAPLAAQSQLQIQIACMGAEAGSIGALISGFMYEFLTYDYDRNDRLIDGLITLSMEFRERCLNDDPPPVDGSVSTRETLKLLHPNANGKAVQMSQTAVLAAQELRFCKAEKKQLESRERELENTIKAELKKNTYGLSDELAVSYKSQTRKGKVEVPYELAGKLAELGIEHKVIEPSTYRVLREVDPKKIKLQLEHKGE